MSANTKAIAALIGSNRFVLLCMNDKVAIIPLREDGTPDPESGPAGTLPTPAAMAEFAVHTLTQALLAFLPDGMRHELQTRLARPPGELSAPAAHSLSRCQQTAEAGPLAGEQCRLPALHVELEPCRFTGEPVSLLEALEYNRVRLVIALEEGTAIGRARALAWFSEWEKRFAR